MLRRLCRRTDDMASQKGGAGGKGKGALAVAKGKAARAGSGAKASAKATPGQASVHSVRFY